METKQQNKTNGRNITNDVLIMLLRAGVIAAMLCWARRRGRPVCDE